MVRCENNYCIYNTNKECGLEEISIGMQANCLECTEPEISDQILAAAKQKTLARLQTHPTPKKHP